MLILPLLKIKISTAKPFRPYSKNRSFYINTNKCHCDFFYDFELTTTMFIPRSRDELSRDRGINLDKN
jgi:hypothetical protein